MKPYLAFLTLLGLFSIPVFGQNADNDTTDINLRVFEKVEVEATYPGGLAGWRAFLEKTLNPNVPVDNGAPIGSFTVWVQFIVDKDGTISDIKALTKLGFGMEEEVIRTIRNSGKWEPAIQNSRAVKAYRKQPITFVVTDDELDIVSAEQYVLHPDVDNELMIVVKKVKQEDLVVTISKGTIRRAPDGNYLARVRDKSGRVLIRVTNSKKNKVIGTVSFEIRPGTD